MKKIRLGLNIDHVATVRNARGEIYPDPIRAALLAEKSGVDSITIHLREDRRHIKDKDLSNLKKKLKIPLNLEMAPTKRMLDIAVRHRPNFVCIVPEKRQEITTEGGLNLNKKENFLRKIILKLKRKKIRVSLFIEPKVSNINKSVKLGADCIEINTGKFCSILNKGKDISEELKQIKKTCKMASKLGLEVHAGHGLNYKSIFHIKKIKYISELNIGHFIIGESIFMGLKNVIANFKKILNI